MPLIQRIAAGAAGVVLASFSLAGCGAADSLVHPGGKRLTGGCGVVVDGSGTSASASGFDASAQITGAVPAFLAAANCRYVEFGPIDGTSQSSVCTQPRLDLDPDAAGDVDRTALRASHRQLAVQRAAKVLQCVQTDPRSVKGSDVLGGIANMAAIAADGTDGPAPMRVLVISDFDNNNNGVDVQAQIGQLADPAARSEIIKTLDAKGTIPDLRQIDLYTAGYGLVFPRQPGQVQAFTAFWNDVLRDHGHVHKLVINPYHVDVHASPTPAAA